MHYLYNRAVGRMAKIALALVIFSVIGLQLESRIIEDEVSNIIKGITDIKEDTGILYAKSTQFAVLCYIPTGKGLSYKGLKAKGLCDWSAPNNNVHSEQILLKNAFTVLQKNYMYYRKMYNRSHNYYKVNTYDILLYTFNSPCKTCAEMIVKTLSEAHAVFEFRVAYYQRYIWLNRIPPDPDGTQLLQMSTDIFNEFNTKTAGIKNTPFISIRQYTDIFGLINGLRRTPAEEL